MAGGTRPERDDPDAGSDAGGDPEVGRDGPPSERDFGDSAGYGGGGSTLDHHDVGDPGAGPTPGQRNPLDDVMDPGKASDRLDMRDEDHVRAAFGLSGSPVGGGDGTMRGGYGGEGYRHYGSETGSGPQGAGAVMPTFLDDDGPDSDGSAGEEDDRGV